MTRGPYKGSFLYSIYQIDDDIVKDVIASSFSIREVACKLNLRLNGSAYPAFKKYVIEKSISVSHFLGKANNVGLKHKGGYDRNKILSKKSKSRSGTLRNALLLSGRAERCEGCKLGNIWQDSPIVLEVDHINGNNSDNTLDNLRFLCPNCHSQTPTFRGRGKNSGVKKVSDEQLLSALLEKHNIRQALKHVGLAAKGGNYNRAKKLLSRSCSPTVEAGVLRTS